MHADGGWCIWIVGRENKSSPILAIMIGSFLGSGNNVVPSRRFRVSRSGGRMFRKETVRDLLKDVVFGGVSRDIRRRILLEMFVFARKLNVDVRALLKDDIWLSLTRLFAWRVAIFATRSEGMGNDKREDDDETSDDNEWTQLRSSA